MIDELEPEANLTGTLKNKSLKNSNAVCMTFF